MARDSAFFHLTGHPYRIDVMRGIDISIPLQFNGDQPNAFFLRAAASAPVESADFVGDTRQGGSVNCRDILLNPHGNGTHTECVSHVVDTQVAVYEQLPQPWLFALVLTVRPRTLGASGEMYNSHGMSVDQVVTRSHLIAAYERLAESGLNALWTDEEDSFGRALVLRTLPNPLDKCFTQYGGTNPPYLTREAMLWIRQERIEHLLVDLPSIDREDDGGQVLNHRIFWELQTDQREIDLEHDGPWQGRTITELIYVPDEVYDGPYMLNLQVPAFVNDAAPSRPLLFPLVST